MEFLRFLWTSGIFCGSLAPCSLINYNFLCCRLNDAHLDFKGHIAEGGSSATQFELQLFQIQLIVEKLTQITSQEVATYFALQAIPNIVPGHRVADHQLHRITVKLLTVTMPLKVDINNNILAVPSSIISIQISHRR